MKIKQKKQNIIIMKILSGYVMQMIFVYTFTFGMRPMFVEPISHANLNMKIF
jgi:hypothetical protein